MTIRSGFALIVLSAMTIAAPAQRHYVCYYAAKPPIIDGSGVDQAWAQAPWTEDFGDIEGNIRPRPRYTTRAKMLWDSTCLYIYAELQEPDLWATLHQHDTIIYDDNDFEAFINPDNSTHRYFELEINALGTVMDLFMDKPYRNNGKALLSWDTQGLLSAVKTSGTLNHPGDVDMGWSVEMAIPLKSLIFWGDDRVKDGSLWRINFSRVEWDRDVRNGQYQVRTNMATGRRLPEHNWVWSPQGIIDMHAPEKWAFVQFSSHAGGADSVAFIPPADLEARRWLWKVYYAQKDYQKKHGRYAVSLHELGLPGTEEMKMEATPRQFLATVRTLRPPVNLTIDQDALVATSR